MGPMRLSISSLWPWMTARMLLKSWATPPAIRPTASRRRASRSSSSRRRPRARSSARSRPRRSTWAIASASVRSRRVMDGGSPDGTKSPKVVAMRTGLHGGIGEQREHDPEDGAAARNGSEVDAAAVVLDDLVGQGQAQPGTAVLGREERVEDAIGVPGRDADAAVLDLHADAPPRRGAPARQGHV